MGCNYMINKQPKAQPINLPELTDSEVAQAWINTIGKTLPRSQILEDPSQYTDQQLDLLENYLLNELNHQTYILNSVHKNQDDQDD